MLRIRVTTASAEILETELITAGRRGLQCSFAFSDDWEGLAKTVIVRGVVKRDIVLVGDTITVPGECLEREQFPLHIGVYGANGEGEIVIPTIWADFGKIRPSARPSGISPDEVSPNVVAQIQQNSSNALYLAQLLTKRAAAGEFKGDQGDPGIDGVDGVDGNSIWYTTRMVIPRGEQYITPRHLMEGREGTPKAGDLVIASEPGESNDPTYLYCIVDDLGAYSVLRPVGSIKGDTGATGAAGTAGENGDDGGSIWWSSTEVVDYTADDSGVPISSLQGRDSVEPVVGDLVLANILGTLYLWRIYEINSARAFLSRIAQVTGPQGAKGDPGTKGDTGTTGPQGATGPAGADGSSVWYTTSAIIINGEQYWTPRINVEGRDGTPQAGDLLIGSEPGERDNPTYLYCILGEYGPYSTLKPIGSLKGATGATGPQGPAGADYVLTAADKDEIVDDVLAALPTWTGGAY